MKKPLLFIIASMMIAEAYAARPHGKMTELNIMSFNIRYENKFDKENGWDDRKEACIEVIRRESPDVAGFQEPRIRQVNYLTENLTDYANVRLGNDFGLKGREDGGYHVMIMWKRDKYLMLDHGSFWMSETPEKASIGWDAHNRRVAVWVRLMDLKTRKQFVYLTTHFDHKGVVARQKEAEMIADRIREMSAADPTLPVFVSGDLNMRIDNPSLAPLHALMRPARETAPETDDKPSYNGFGKTRQHYLDHIFYRNAEPVRYRTLDGDYGIPYVSDHYPVICTFRLYPVEKRRRSENAAAKKDVASDKN